MMSVSAASVTQLLFDWQQGDQSALNKLTPLIYDELRRIAHHYVKHERNGHTFRRRRWLAAYVRLAGQERPEWQIDRTFAVTAR
jgi:hypothetical protein